MSKIDPVIALLDAALKIDRSDFLYHIEKTEAIREWALDKAGVNYGVGDRVIFIDSPKLDPGNGWYPYREVLVSGARATVHDVDFNKYGKYWYASIILDVEYSLSSLVRDDAPIKFWHGPASETPEGMDEPSSYDQEHHPNGRKHVFEMPVKYLAKLVGEDKNGTNNISTETHSNT